MTIYQGTLLYNCIKDILVRNQVEVTYHDDLVSLFNKLQKTFPKSEVDHILLSTYKVIGFNYLG